VALLGSIFIISVEDSYMCLLQARHIEDPMNNVTLLHETVWKEYI